MKVTFNRLDEEGYKKRIEKILSTEMSSFETITSNAQRTFRYVYNGTDGLCVVVHEGGFYNITNIYGI